jgi:hypothetical protein
MTPHPDTEGGVFVVGLPNFAVPSEMIIEEEKSWTSNNQQDLERREEQKTMFSSSLLQKTYNVVPLRSDMRDWSLNQTDHTISS